MGVRQIQLSHNQRNFVVDSCWEPTNAGLSRFGRRLIAELNRSRVLIDVAHVGESSTLETVSRSSAPVLASHTGCLALCPHPRNKSDRVMKAIADRGGVICIYNMSGWMSRQPEPDMGIYLRHLKHALDAAGEDHVGFGTDGDPAAMSQKQLAWEIDYSQAGFDEQVKDFPRLDWPIRHIRIPELDSPDRLLNLARAMEREGYAARIIEKVIGGNYFRLFREVVG
jgi:membrane dipeptidase